MGDIVYPAFVAGQINDDLGRINRALENRINEIEERTGKRPSFRIYNLPCSQKRAIVSGVDMPFDECRRQFGGVQMDGVCMRVEQPDFGFPRDNKSYMDFQKLRLNYHLIDGQRGQGIINIFHAKFIEDLGTFAALTPAAVIENMGNQIDLSKLENAGEVLYTHTSGYRGYRTEVEFKFILEAVNAKCIFNGGNQFSWRDQLFTRHPNKGGLLRCNLEMCSGIGKDENVNIQEMVRRHGYVPLSELSSAMYDEGVFDFTKGGLYSQCPTCNSLYKIVGIDPNLRWLAAQCDCNMDLFPFCWKGENFARLCVTEKVAKTMEKFGTLSDKFENPLVLFIRGLMPTYNSVAHFRESAFAAYRLEARELKIALHKEQPTGRVMSIRELEVITLKNKPRQVFLVRMLIQRTKTWCNEGKINIARATLMPLIEATRNNDGYEHIPYLQTIAKRHIRSKVVAIRDCDEKHANVFLHVVPPPGGHIQLRHRYILTPRPPKTERNAIRRALAKWDKSTNCVGVQQREGYILRAMAISGVPSQMTTRAILWKFTIKVFIIKKSLSMLEELLHNSYIGIKALVHLNFEGIKRSFRLDGRLAKISDDETEIYFVLPENVSIIEDSQISFTIWIASTSGNCPIATTNAKPAGYEEEDYIDSEDEMLELNDDDDEEEELGKHKNNFRETTGAAKTDTEMEPFEFLTKDFMPTQDTNDVDRVISEWMFPPVSEFDFLRYLLKDSKLESTSLLPLFCHSQSNGDEAAAIRANLNISQLLAVDRMISNRLSIIKGPPGTGKTTTICHAIANLWTIEKGIVFLMCPSNYAADVAFEKMNAINNRYGLKMRIVRMIAHGRERSKPDDDYEGDLLHVVIKQHKDYRNGRLGDIIHVLERDEQETLTTSDRRLYAAHVTSLSADILCTYDVVVCTVACGSDMRLANVINQLSNTRRLLSAIFVDEASLLTVPSATPVFSFNPARFCLAGDESQLGPTVKCFGAQHACLDVSLMEMLMISPVCKENDIFTMLTIQYRMAEPIGTLVSAFMYENRLTNDSTVISRNYRDMYDGFLQKFPELSRTNMCVYDYSGGREGKQGNSTINMKEVDIIRQLLLRLSKTDVGLHNVCVISMYEGQTRQLLNMAESYPEFAGLEIATVDSYQGKEKNIVILSTVRCNAKNNVGFMRDTKRLNVAMSRAKDFLLIVASARTLFGCKLWDYEQLHRLLKNGGTPLMVNGKHVDWF